MDKIDKLQKTPYHVHNGIDAPKIEVLLNDIITPQISPASPTGGVVIDAEARTAIDSIITKLETIGIFI